MRSGAPRDAGDYRAGYAQGLHAVHGDGHGREAHRYAHRREGGPADVLGARARRLRSAPPLSRRIRRAGVRRLRRRQHADVPALQGEPGGTEQAIYVALDIPKDMANEDCYDNRDGLALAGVGGVRALPWRSSTPTTASTTTRSTSRATARAAGSPTCGAATSPAGPTRRESSRRGITFADRPRTRAAICRASPRAAAGRRLLAPRPNRAERPHDRDRARRPHERVRHEPRRREPPGHLARRRPAHRRHLQEVRWLWRQCAGRLLRDERPRQGGSERAHRFRRSSTSSTRSSPVVSGPAASASLSASSATRAAAPPAVSEGARSTRLGCPVISEELPCGPGFVCCPTCGLGNAPGVTACAPIPGCAPVPEGCRSPGTFCLDENTLATCTLGDSTPQCLTVTDVTPCAANQKCTPPGQCQ